MNTKKVTTRFIILIPHRDAGNRLEEYRQKLFSGAVNGAFAFPAAAPLAEVSRPFSLEELKELARNIRRLAEENTAANKLKTGGKFVSQAAGVIVKTGQMSFFGPALNFSLSEETFPEPARGNIIRVLNPPVLCAAAVKSDGENPAENPFYEPAPPLSFGAAALANLAIRPLASGVFRSEASGEPDYSYEWKIGARVWLPKTK